MCIGCRERRPQDDLLRLIRATDGTLEIGRRLPGRGAWVCPDAACIDQAERKWAFGRAFKAELADGALDGVRARMVERAAAR
jgi:predicted RNA-binding protein YlxR (DUF448 family)